MAMSGHMNGCGKLKNMNAWLFFPIRYYGRIEIQETQRWYDKISLLVGFEDQILKSSWGHNTLESIFVRETINVD
jgi:hypothetical protein